MSLQETLCLSPPGLTPENCNGATFKHQLILPEKKKMQLMKSLEIGMIKNQISDPKMDTLDFSLTCFYILSLIRGYRFDFSIFKGEKYTIVDTHGYSGRGTCWLARRRVKEQLA